MKKRWSYPSPYLVLFVFILACFKPLALQETILKSLCEPREIKTSNPFGRFHKYCNGNVEL